MKRIIAITTLAAALLLGGTAHAGWYLMQPYYSVALNSYEVDKPISQWFHNGSFDSAAECERARNSTAEEWRAQGLTDAQVKGIMQTESVSQCIAADDPRLR
jgi:hypothetical protein